MRTREVDLLISCQQKNPLLSTGEGLYRSDEAFYCAQGGTRTHTPKNRILSAARLPIPPLGQVRKLFYNTRFYPRKANRASSWKKSPGP